jgi:hypothetical protein
LVGCAAGRDEIISDSYHDQYAARHGAGELLAGRESGNAPVVRLGESALAPGIPISDWSRSGNWVRRWRSTNSYTQRNWLNAGSFAMPVPQRRHLLGACAAGTLSAFLCGLDHRQDARCCATIQHPCFKEVAVPESDNSRKRALECLRLEADCMQLAGVVHGPALQTHFVRMAREWSSLAIQGPKAGTQIKNRTKWS